MPHTAFLFWNINRKPLAELVAELAVIHDVDALLSKLAGGRETAR